jgi:plastocyanin
MKRTALLLVAPVALAAVAVACFSERNSGPTLTGGVAECQVPFTVIDSMHVIVAIRNFLFNPDSVVVRPGGTVTWVNCETPPQEPHTTTSDAAVWDSPDLNPGERFSHTFAAPGAFLYHCTPHPFMLGKVVVQ